MFHKQIAERFSRLAAMPAGPPMRPLPNAAIGPDDIRAELWGRRTWIVLGAVVGLLGGIAFLVLATPRYTAESQLLINPNDLRFFDNSLNAPSSQSDANLAEVESQTRVMVSEKVLRQVVESQRLDQDREFAPRRSFLHTLVESYDDLLGIQPEPIVPAAVAALRNLTRKTAARHEERSYVVDLSVTTAEPEKSVALAKAVVDAYLATQSAARTAAAERATGELSSRLADLQARVRTAEDRVETYKVENNIVNAGSTLISDQQLTETSQQLVEARAKTDAAKSRYQQIRRLLDTHADPGAIAEAVQSPTISGLRLQYAQLVGRQAELNAQLGARHPTVIDNAAQVARMKEQIEAEVRRLAGSAHGDWERAASDQTAVQKTLDSEKAKSITANQAMVHLRELERDAEANRLVYQAFLNRSRETSQQEDLHTANVRVISDATLPDKAYPPSGMLVLLFAIFVGGVAGAGLALLPLLLGRRERGSQAYGMGLGA